jgi:hypothetical protein
VKFALYGVMVLEASSLDDALAKLAEHFSALAYATDNAVEYEEHEGEIMQEGQIALRPFDEAVARGDVKLAVDDFDEEENR